jgi:diguanylate cyclase (GGDEF)-like protein/PAS domain S-box-containing protein
LFEQALAAIPSAVVAVDTRSRIRFWNRAAEELFGFLADEALGRTIVELIVVPEKRAVAVDQVGHLRAGESLTGDWEVCDKAGRRFTVALTCTAIAGDDGAVAAVFGVSVDVTARRAEEARLRRLAAIIEGSEDAIIETDRNLVVRTANAAVHDVFGYHADELVGRNVAILTPPDLRPAIGAAVGQVLAGGSPGIVLTRATRLDGTDVDISLRMSPVLDSTGAIVGISGISRDVTDETRTRAALAASERQFRARFEQTAVPQAVVSLTGRFLDVNEALCRLLDRDRDDLVGSSIREVRHPGGDPSEETLQAVLAGRQDAGSWGRTIARPSGGQVEVIVHATLLREADGAPYALAATIQDLSGLRRAEDALRLSEARYRAIAETAQEGIWAIGVNGATLYANDKLAEILGVERPQVYARQVDIVLDPDGSAGFAAELARWQRHEQPVEHELPYAHPDGQQRILRLSVSPLRDGVRRIGTLAMIADVSTARRAEDELRRRALRDELTGLANRNLLTDRLELALARARRRGNEPVAVLFADLDQFKLVNDAWGHAAGDSLLKQVAGRLDGALRSSDTVARFGGDEFVVVCEDTDERTARDVADRVQAILAGAFEVEGNRVYVRASVGVAVSPAPSAAELLQFAESAMYEAKARGRGRIRVFDAAFAAASGDRLALSNDLREALSHGELAMHYQPIVDLATGRLVGVEALARWRHPTRGAVPPDRFVAVAEATGLAPALDRWALHRACQDASRLQALAPDGLRMAVNISARHLTDPDFESTVLAARTAGGPAANGLTLELTESAVMDNPDQACQLLNRLRARGVAAAIDDFGTGYSSLGYLSRLPVSTLKIDRSFVMNIDHDQDSLAITSSIIEMARAMHLNTVAEGIETLEQLDVLRGLGCVAGQGYLWSPAQAPDALIALIESLPEGLFDVGAGRVITNQSPR